MTVAREAAAVARAVPGRAPVVGSLRASIATALGALAPKEGILASATMPLESAPDPIDLFAAALRTGLEPSLLHQPVDHFSMVGIGRAWSVRAEGPDRFGTVADAWERLLDGALIDAGHAGRGAGPLLVGGLGFTGDPGLDPTWRPFGAASFVLPELLFVRTPDGCSITASYVADARPEEPGERLERVWSELSLDTVREPVAATKGKDRAALTVVAEQPDRATWDRLVDRFAGAVGRGRLDKIVLARRADLASSTDIDVAAAVRHLASLSPTSTTYAVVRGGSTFIGATPERLIATRGKDFETVAIAGSTRRDDDATVEAALAADLLASDKDREEHDIVVKMLRAKLEPVASEIAVADSPVVAAFGTVQHLVTTVTGRLKDRAGILSLVELLHPTPAVGGEPRTLALDLIAESEGFERGWYAAPLGWVGADGDGEFVVALRCAVISGRSAALFAGCGIVADSDAGREWEESRNKMAVVASALGELRS